MKQQGGEADSEEVEDDNKTDETISELTKV